MSEKAMGDEESTVHLTKIHHRGTARNEKDQIVSLPRLREGEPLTNSQVSSSGLSAGDSGFGTKVLGFRLSALTP